MCMGPTGNLNGLTRFMCIQTGAKIVQQNFTPLPMADSMIERVKDMGMRDKANHGVTFMYRIKILSTGMKTRKK